MRFEKQTKAARILLGLQTIGRVRNRLGRPGKGLGPVVWCKTCSRKHRRRQTCNLYLRKRTAKSGLVVQRWCH